MIEVSAPASTANLGPGFDVLGLALDLPLVVRVGPHGDPVDDAHPAAVAFARAGGSGPVVVETDIPPARGLGFSGAARVAGSVAGLVQAGRSPDTARDDGLALAVELEGHGDNAGPSALGGLVVHADERSIPLPVALDAAVVVWSPDTGTSTDESRATLPAGLSHDDAVYNLAGVALLVAALTIGDPTELRRATSDRLHQPTRLARLPDSAEAIDAALAGGAWGAWLSGSGPSVAGLVDPGLAPTVAAALAGGGTVRTLAIDHRGVTVRRY
ncbi:MAG: homoserine kinase [Actinomycetia bacterium]|nr:homoserine kinase [Actinomycetes bacterium]MCP3913882.1 homoserine kinase [Actinomycetes bacterium]MCP4084237.1 homoserine kinase [Actinomycetes bacterium]